MNGNLGSNNSISKTTLVHGLLKKSCCWKIQIWLLYLFSWLNLSRIKELVADNRSLKSLKVLVEVLKTLPLAKHKIHQARSSFGQWNSSCYLLCAFRGTSCGCGRWPEGISSCASAHADQSRGADCCQSRSSDLQCQVLQWHHSR